MKRYDAELRNEIINLRQRGYTLVEIQRQVGYIPKSTLSYICRNVIIADSLKDRVKTANLEALGRARQKALSNRTKTAEKHLQLLRASAQVIIKSTRRVDRDKVALAMLYLGEGRKRRSFRGLSLGGSDPTTLKTYLALLSACYGKNLSSMKAAVQYRADQSLEELVGYWADELCLAKHQFYMTKPDPRTVGKPTSKDGYMGVCVITCSGADIQLELSVIAEQYANYVWGYSSADRAQRWQR